MKNLPLSLTLAALSGALTLKSPAAWSPRVRRVYVVAPGAAIGIIAAVACEEALSEGGRWRPPGEWILSLPQLQTPMAKRTVPHLFRPMCGRTRG